MSEPKKYKKVAIIHDWLTGMRGGEYVLEAILELFPDADLFTLIHIPGSVSPGIERHKIHTSFLQKIPQIEKYYRYFLPLMPFAISLFSMKEYDLVISSSHCVAKGVAKNKNAKHISYIHAPMRYMWDRFDDYFSNNKTNFLTRLIALSLKPFLQYWDKKVSQSNRIDTLIANSSFIQKEIKKFYGRSSVVIHPFVNFDRFNRPKEKHDFYLMVGAFAPNKRVDLAIKACNELGRNLKIIGSGQEESYLKSIAGPTVEFLGSLSNAEIENTFSKARAFIFPGKEDFGITPLESLASGTPVIAFYEGGVKDTLSNETAIFFHKQDTKSLKDALLEFEKKEAEFSEDQLKENAKKFSKETFQKKIKFLSS